MNPLHRFPTAAALALAAGVATACPEPAATPAPGAAPVLLKVQAPPAPDEIRWTVSSPAPAASTRTVEPAVITWTPSASGDGIAWATAAPPAEGHERTHAEHHETRHIIITRDDGTTCELKIEDGKREIKVNGKRVGKDRIIEKGGRIVVLGEDGQRLTAFDVGGAGAWAGTPAPLEGEYRIAVEGQLVPGAAQGEYRLAPDGPAAPPVMLGITQSEVPQELRDQLGLAEEQQAILVERVLGGLPAEKAGLRANDVIVSIEGDNKATQATLREHLLSKEPGDTLKLVVISKGERKTIEVELAEYDAERLGVPSQSGGTFRLTPRIEGHAHPLAPEFDWGRFGREQREMAREEVLRALREHGLSEHDRHALQKDVERALQGMEESMRGHFRMAEEYAREASRAARERAMELRGDRLVLPRTPATPGGEALEDRLGSLEERLEGLEDRIEERMDALMDRLEATLDRLEEGE